MPVLRLEFSFKPITSDTALKVAPGKTGLRKRQSA